MEGTVDVLRRDLQAVPTPTNTQAIFGGLVKTGTVEADDNVVTSTAHGLAVDDVVRFTSLTGGTGLAVATNYWVISVPTANTFTISATKGGSAVDVTVDATAFNLLKVNLDTVSLTNADSLDGSDADADAGYVSIT